MNNKIRLSVFLITIIAFCLYFISQDIKVTNDFYSEEAQSVMKELNIASKISKSEYSKTVEAMLTSGSFKEKYVDSYFKVDYIERADFTDTLNIFIELNYKPEIINYIYTLNNENFNIIKSSEYIELKDFLNIGNIEVSKIERYFNYKNKNSVSLQSAVTMVNIGLDLDFYSHYKIIDNLNSYHVLVNKYNYLPEDYVPEDLVSIQGFDSFKMRPEASKYITTLIKDANDVGIKLEPYSTYRSYTRQSTLYDTYVSEDGIDIADKYSARPGFSEHQTGLAADIRSVGYLADVSIEASDWLLQNSYKYGYILRYLEETTFITGYESEPWHIRYVGVNIATDIVSKKLTFEEYYDLYLK